MNEQSNSNEQLSNVPLEQKYENHKAEVLAIRTPSYQLYRKKQVGKGKGTFLERDLFESDAFWALKGAAPQMLIYLLGKRIFPKSRKGRVCVNENELTLSYIELQKLGVTQPRATRGFDEMLAKGFIELKHQGGGYQKDQSIYSLSSKYLFWKKGTVFFKRPTVFKRGFQGGKKGKNNIRKRCSSTHTETLVKKQRKSNGNVAEEIKYIFV